jgi:hypothetical protein
MKNSSDHLELLCEASRAAVVRLNHNPQIGRDAPGDGDLFEWFWCFVNILTYEYHVRHPNVQLQTLNTPPKRSGKEPVDVYLSQSTELKPSHPL